MIQQVQHIIKLNQIILLPQLLRLTYSVINLLLPKQLSLIEENVLEIVAVSSSNYKLTITFILRFFIGRQRLTCELLVR